jgi:hypothetical protein
MRFMLTFRIPMEQGNAAVKDGSINQTVQAILDELKPEAAYFRVIDGARGGYLVVTMDDASQIPALVEPLFLGIGATVELHPVMTVDDLMKAAPSLEQAAQKYG